MDETVVTLQAVSLETPAASPFARTPKSTAVAGNCTASIALERGGWNQDPNARWFNESQLLYYGPITNVPLRN